ncbi:MAG TPA: carbohydrate ABC transporter permease [Streptosporangiaceae bacterium]|nr:carbohydrate ABC transporter permease [Streptosporangiaceae bacterium]
MRAVTRSRPAVLPGRAAGRSAGVRETGTAGPAGPRNRATRIVVVGVLVVVAIYFLVPVYWLIVASTKSPAGIYGSQGFLFSNPMFATNMVQVFTYDGDIYTRWLVNTVLYAGVGAVLATLFAAAAGYVLAKYEFRGRRALFNLVLAGVLVPATALALPMYQLFASVNLTNTYWAVLIPGMVSPFGVYLCRIYAEAAVPDTVLEAARIDGSGEVRIFFRVVLRILTPVLVTVFLFQFVGIWNNYFLPLVMLSSNSLYPITLGLTTWQAGSIRVPELLQTTIGGALVSVIPLAVAMIVLQRFWQGGLTEGAVKQ